ncbi:RidA family protein [Streptomyces fractus]|uniref:RidA family protein n=1 Tax=Streptomyces fractus TaxID=641806 RepID=UPI003CEC0F62
MPTFISSTSQDERRPRRSSGVTVDNFTFATVTATDPATGRRAADAATVTDEVRRCFASLDDVLRQAGLSRGDLVKTTCWLSDDAYRAEFIDAYRAECAPGVHPQRVTMRAGLPGGCRVAIEAVAARS